MNPNYCLGHVRLNTEFADFSFDTFSFVLTYKSNTRGTNNPSNFVFPGAENKTVGVVIFDLGIGL